MSADQPASPGPVDELTMTLLLRAADRHGMTKETTDWEAVCRAASRASKAVADLALAAGDRPLRVVRPRR